MTEKATNKVAPLKGIKVWDHALDWFKAEQARQKKLTGSEPTQWELFDLMIRVFENPDSEEAMNLAGATKSSRQVLEMMAWLLGPDGPTDDRSNDWKESLRWSAKRWADERKKR